MNKTVPSPTNWPDQKKPRRLQAIDENTPYDATGGAIRHIRQLRAGKFGKVTDVLIIARCLEKATAEQGGIRYVDFANGLGTAETYADLARALVRRFSR